MSDIISLIEPVFQPIVDMDGQLYAYETLLRLRGHTERSPQKMIERWEKSGFIQTVDHAMLRSVIKVLERTLIKSRIAVNVSIKTIESNGDSYRTALLALAAKTSRLIVELTETVEINDVAAVIRFAAACQAMGIRIALDDCQERHLYGTENFIKNIRPSLIKLDGIFLQRCFNSGDTDEMRRIIELAHRFNAGVIAEHVSDEALKAFAFRFHVDFVQGLAIGKPKPARFSLNYHHSQNQKQRDKNTAAESLSANIAVLNKAQ